MNTEIAPCVEAAVDGEKNATAASTREYSNPLLGRFGLGAAQFGMNYGRFNLDGKPSVEHLSEILHRARQFGLTAVDTARLYGDSEAALGACGPFLGNFEIITKTPRFSEDGGHDDNVLLRRAFEQSLTSLKRSATWGLLIHHAPDLLAPQGERLYREMLALKSEGLVEHIGVSAYTGEIAEEINRRFPLDLVQLPMNVLDQRLIYSGTLARLAGAGVKIHIRSAFLQGLLLADPHALTSHFTSARPALVAFQEAACAADMSAAHAAMHFLLKRSEIDRIIVGVDSITQLEQLFAAFPPAPTIDFAAFRIDQPEILNPALWPN